MSKPKVLIIWNDTIPHKGSDKAKIWEEVLLRDGFDVESVPSTYPICDPARLRTYSLIVMGWSEGMIIPEQGVNLIRAVGFDGVGMAGYHEMATAFGDRGWHFLFGTYMVAHPGLAADGEKHDYIVHVTKPDDPIMRGITDFEVQATEQFYVLTDGDNFNEVLADTKMACSDYPWIVGASSPVAFKRRFGAGRIFYQSVGHFAKDFQNENVFKIMHRGMLWAARELPEGLVIE